MRPPSANCPLPSDPIGRSSHWDSLVCPRSGRKIDVQVYPLDLSSSLQGKLLSVIHQKASFCRIWGLVGPHVRENNPLKLSIVLLWPLAIVDLNSSIA